MAILPRVAQAVVEAVETWLAVQVERVEQAVDAAVAVAVVVVQLTQTVGETVAQEVGV